MRLHPKILAAALAAALVAAANVLLPSLAEPWQGLVSALIPVLAGYATPAKS